VKVQLKTVVAILAGVITVAFGAAVLHWALGPLLAAVAAAAVLGAALALLRMSTDSARPHDPIVRWLMLAGLWRASLIVALSAMPEQAWAFALGGLGLSWGELLAADFLGRRRRRAVVPPPVPEIEPVVSPDVSPVTLSAMRAVQASVEDAGWPYLVVSKPEPLSADQVRYTVAVPSRIRAQQILEAQAALAAAESGQPAPKAKALPFGPDAAEPIAIALGERMHRKLERGWVKVEESPFAGEYYLTVMTRDIRRDVIPYVDDLTLPRSAKIPACLGRYDAGDPFELPMGHGEIIAKTESGKTNLLYGLATYYTACGWTDPRYAAPSDKVVLWIGGRRKQYETWGAFLHRYFGTGKRIPLGWVANGQHDTVNMLLAAMIVVKARQTAPLDERGERPTLVVMIDEYTDVSSDNTVTVHWDGIDWTATMLDEALSRGAASAGVRLIRVMHRGTNGAAGSSGAGIKAAFDWSIALRSNDKLDLGRVTGAYRLPPLQYPGELYATIKGGDPRRAKSRYTQEIGKPNAHQTDGTPVDVIGWSRRDMISELEPRAEDAARTVPAYVARHQVMDAAFRDYLTGDASTTPAAAPSAGAGTTTAERIREQIAAVVAKQQGTAAPGLAAVPEPVAVTVQPEPTRGDLVEAILQERGAEGLTSAALIAELRERGDEVRNPNAVYNLLKSWRDTERAEKVGDRWRLVQHAGAAA
jgi:hypothetical protein